MQPMKDALQNLASRKLGATVAGITAIVYGGQPFNTQCLIAGLAVIATIAQAVIDLRKESAEGDG